MDKAEDKAKDTAEDRDKDQNDAMNDDSNIIIHNNSKSNTTDDMRQRKGQEQRQ